MKNYTDFELAELLFGPNGIERYLDDKKMFQGKFGMPYKRDSLISVITKYIPEQDRANKNRKLMQPLVTHYNKVAAGKRKKDSDSHAGALDKTLEIIYVFAVNEPSKVAGLKEKLVKMGYGDLVESARDIYKERIKEYRRIANMHDVITKMEDGLEGIREDIDEKHKELLEAIVKIKEEEKEQAEEELKETIDELITLIQQTKEKDYPKMVKKIVEYLGDIRNKM